MALTASIDLDDQLGDRLRRIALERQEPVEDTLRAAIAQFVTQAEGQEQFRQDALAAWDDYKLTGLHLTDGEVERWLLSWGREGELPTPECHR